METVTCILKNTTYPFFSFLLLPLLFLSSCTLEPQPIEFGTDICHYCKMTIVDQRYGAQLVTKKGKVYKFDATECMVNAVYADKLFPEQNIHSFLTVAYDKPRDLTLVSDAVFLQSPTLPSPMGMFLTAFSTQSELETAMKQHQGKSLDWEEVKRVVLENVRP